MKLWWTFMKFSNWLLAFSNWKSSKVKSLILTMIVVCFCAIPSKISKGCGIVKQNFDGYTFLNPLIINNTAPYAPFFLDFDDLFGFFDTKNLIQSTSNLTEWYDRFCETSTIEDMEQVIYKYSIQDLQQLRTATLSEGIPLATRLQKNSFARHLESYKCIETTEYLIFAKRCEPHVVKSKNSWETPKRDYAAMQELIREGRKAFKKTESHYIRLRYAYQLVRLAHYAKLYEEALELEEWLLPKIDNRPSIIEWWIMGHKAGALMGLGRNVEAAYLYAKIFQNCPSKRRTAFQSFTIKTDEEWQECLTLCENDVERATLYAIRASADESNTIEELESIYALDPLNENLEILLIKEIKKRERELLGHTFSDSYVRHNRSYHKKPSKVAGQKIIELQNFARKCREEKKVARPDFWHLSEGYLEFLAGDYYAAERTFDLVKEEVQNDTLQEQLNAFQLALNIAAWDEISDGVEKEAVSIMRSSEEYEKYVDFPDYMRDKLAQLYKETGSPGKAFLCHYEMDMLRPNPQELIVNDLMRLAMEEGVTRFERFLEPDPDHDKFRNNVLDIKGTMYFREYQLEAALESYKEMDRANWNQFSMTNPFLEKLNDCVNCEIHDSIPKYNRGDIIERILNYEYAARAEVEKAALNYYRIGNAFYNMSYFGHAWQAMDDFRSGSSYHTWNLKDKDFVFSHYAFPYGNKENMDVSRPLYYFERSRLLAKNRELAARSTFGAAKCEQKQYFTSDEYKAPKRGNIPKPSPNYLNYTNLFLSEYSDTQYYLEVIQECQYFRVYATQ